MVNEVIEMSAVIQMMIWPEIQLMITNCVNNPYYFQEVIDLIIDIHEIFTCCLIIDHNSVTDIGDAFNIRKICRRYCIIHPI